MIAFLLFQTAERVSSISLWGIVVPATIFIISFTVTWYLYRHFAKQVDGEK